MQESHELPTTGTLTGAEAMASLDEIERRRHRVIDEIDMPTWYWWGLALGWVGLGVLTDLRIAWLTLAATFAFGAIHAAVSQWVIGGRRRTSQLSVRQDVAGRHTPLLVVVSLLALAGVTIAGALVAAADGARHPVTEASIVVAIIIVLGGPRLMAAVRSRAARSPFEP